MDASTGSGSSSPAARCARTWTSKIRSIHKTASRNPLQAVSNVAMSLLFRNRCGQPAGELARDGSWSDSPGVYSHAEFAGNLPTPGVPGTGGTALLGLNGNDGLP